MKSIFLSSVALCVLSVITKDACCKSLGSIDKKGISSSENSDNETRDVTSNKLSSSVIDKMFRTKREIVNTKNVVCPLSMRRVVTCVPIRKFRHGRHSQRKHGLHKNK